MISVMTQPFTAGEKVPGTSFVKVASIAGLEASEKINPFRFCR
jgi:hypothetical protein